jgi:hypothetical protein
MKPKLSDALRFPGGTRLQVEITLKPLLREAAEKALVRYSVSIAAIETATILVRKNEAEGGELFTEWMGENAASNASIAAIRSEQGDYLFNIIAMYAERQRGFDLSDIMFQIIGRHDVYLSRATEQGPVAFAKLRYATDGASVAVSVFTQALLHRVPQALQSLLPAELKIATLSIAKATLNKSLLDLFSGHILVPRQR